MGAPEGFFAGVRRESPVLRGLLLLLQIFQSRLQFIDDAQILIRLKYSVFQPDSSFLNATPQVDGVQFGGGDVLDAATGRTVEHGEGEDSHGKAHDPAGLQHGLKPAGGHPAEPALPFKRVADTAYRGLTGDASNEFLGRIDVVNPLEETGYTDHVVHELAAVRTRFSLSFERGAPKSFRVPSM